MSAPETIDLPHGETLPLLTGTGHVGLVLEPGWNSAILVAGNGPGHNAEIILSSAARRWLAAELLFGLEEEQG